MVILSLYYSTIMIKNVKLLRNSNNKKVKCTLNVNVHLNQSSVSSSKEKIAYK